MSTISASTASAAAATYDTSFLQPQYTATYKGELVTLFKDTLGENHLHALLTREMTEFRKKMGLKTLSISPHISVVFFEKQAGAQDRITTRMFIEDEESQLKDCLYADCEHIFSGHIFKPARFIHQDINFDLLHFIDHGVPESSERLLDLFLEAGTEFIRTAQDRRLRIQAYGKFFQKSLRVEPFDSFVDRLKEAIRQLFHLMPEEFQEDVKYALWKLDDSPETHGSDHGWALFLADPLHPHAIFAATLAIKRPRYCAKRESETLLEQYETCLHLARTLKNSRRPVSELLVYQAFELGFRLQPADTLPLLTLFDQVMLVPFKLHFLEKLKQQEMLDSLEQARLLFLKEPLNPPCMRLMRHFQHQRLVTMSSMDLPPLRSKV